MSGLSQSKVMDGLPRLPWLKVHRPELVRHPPSTERIFAIGHEIGRIAKEPGTAAASWSALGTTLRRD